jgi:hypothetical protein
MLIHDCEQRSDEWYSLRAGKPTASAFSNIITSKGAVSKSLPGYALTLAGEVFAGKPLDSFEGTAWTARGTELESHAASAYEFVHDVEVVPVGFVTDDDQQYGCSPDGLIGDDGMIEIKCLKAENHIAAILRWRKDGEPDPKYLQQVQGQMWICGRQWCDLVFYHPDLPALTIRQAPDRGLQDAMARYLPTVLAERDEILVALRAHQNGST